MTLSDGSTVVFTALNKDGFIEFLLITLSESRQALFSIGLTLKSSPPATSQTLHPSSTTQYNPLLQQTSSPWYSSLLGTGLQDSPFRY